MVCTYRSCAIWSRTRCLSRASSSFSFRRCSRSSFISLSCCCLFISCTSLPIFLLSISFLRCSSSSSLIFSSLFFSRSSHVRRAPVSVPLLPPLSFQMYLNKKRSVCFVANTRKSVRFVVAQKKNEFFRTSHPSPICRLTWWRRRYRSSWYRRCLICRNKTNRIIV